MARNLGRAGIIPNLVGAVPIPSFSYPSIDEAEENLFLYNESPTALGTCVNNVTAGGLPAALCGDIDGGGAVSLAEYNQGITGGIGGIDATGNIANFDKVRFRGVPFARSIYRSMTNDFDEITWRVNIDYTPTDDDLIYFSVTTGYRAGGFNLGYFSFIPTYDPEDLIAYELGYKGQMFDGTVQLNASMYLYEYDDIHLQFDTFSFTGVSTSVQNAPSARTIGGELEGLWLVTDNLTVGVNYSFTDAEYNEELVEPVTGTRGVVDGNNATTPASIFTVAERNLLIDGQALPRVPRHKATGWAEYVQRLGNRGRITYLTSLAWTHSNHPSAGTRQRRDLNALRNAGLTSTVVV